VDALDLAILQEMSRGRIMWWGTSDPRISVRGIARRLHVDPSTIWARFRAWERCGFLLGYSVVPNPRLLGARLAGGGMRVDDPRLKPAVLSDFGLVDGAAFAADQVGPWVVVMFAYESTSDLDRYTRLTRRLRGVEEVEPCIPFTSPEPSVSPSKNDWRILKSLHDHPRSTISACAKAAKLSPRTFAARYDALVRGNAVWSVPVLDFTRYEGASVARLLIMADRSADTRGILSSIEKKFPTSIVLEDHSSVIGSDGPPFQIIALFLQRESVGAVEETEAEVRSIPGVKAVQTYYPRRLFVYDGWFRSRLDMNVKAG
jgi:DNA-binding Lrp family transcriptional regulator